MKSINPILAVIVGLVASLFTCKAQDYEWYYTVPGNRYVETLPNAELYAIPDHIMSMIYVGEPSFVLGKRDIINIDNAKIKRVRKSQQLKVVRFTNVVEQPRFDAYVVEYKEKLWILRSSDVKDNAMLDERNAIMHQKRELSTKTYKDNMSKIARLKVEQDSLERRITILKAEYTKECQDSLDYYTRLSHRLPIIRDSLVTAAYEEEQAKVDKEYDKWYAAQPASTKAALKAIHIEESVLSKPDDYSACSYYLTIRNKSSKVIKYVNWVAVACNAVYDPVACYYNGNKSIKGQIIGPLAQDERGSYVWDDVVYNNLARYLKFTRFEIIYMDGSKVTFSGGDIERTMQEPDTKVTVDKSRIISGVMSDITCASHISLWSSRLESVGKVNIANSSNELFEATKRWQRSSNDNFNGIVSQLNDVNTTIRITTSAATKASAEGKNFDNFVAFKSYNTTATSVGKSSGDTGADADNRSAKSPFVKFGVEASIEGLKSFSAGVGPIMRIGRPSTRFSSTIALKYQTTAVWDDAEYTSPTPPAYEYTARYKRKVHELVVPIVLNWNYARDEDFCMFMGVGYEHGFVLAKRDKFTYMDSNFQVDDFWQYGNSQDWRNLSIPTRAVVLQLGIGCNAFDMKLYYKIYANRTRFNNGTPGAIGASLAIYF